MCVRSYGRDSGSGGGGQGDLLMQGGIAAEIADSLLEGLNRIPHKTEGDIATVTEEAADLLFRGGVVIVTGIIMVVIHT